jgi:hypothetical protein
MRLPFFRKEYLSVGWSYDASGVIWKIVPAEKKYLVGEVRDTTNRKVEYFVLDVLTGNQLWRKNIFDPWWVGIEVVHNNFIVFHGYETPELPEHLNVIVVDDITGSVIWSAGDLKYLFIKDDELYAVRHFKNTASFVKCELATGKIIGECDEEAVNDIHKSVDIKKPDNINYPDSLELIENENVKLIGNQIPDFRIMEYLIQDGKVIIAGYTTIRNSNNSISLHHELIIVKEENKKIIYRDTISHKSAYPLNGTFLFMSGKIIHPKENKIINAIII